MSPGRISILGHVLLDGIPNCNDLSALPQILPGCAVTSYYLSIFFTPLATMAARVRGCRTGKKVRSHFYYRHYYRYRNACPRRGREKYRRKIRSISRNCESSRTVRFFRHFESFAGGKRDKIVLIIGRRVFFVKYKCTICISRYLLTER